MAKIILFDGVCNFCNFWVRFVCKRNRKGLLKFASLQSDIGQQILIENNLQTNTLSTVIFLDEGQLLFQSDAALRICKYLDGIVKLFYVFTFIPKTIRDFIYSIIAKNRYAWFGKSETCMVPTEELRGMFL